MHRKRKTKGQSEQIRQFDLAIELFLVSTSGELTCVVTRLHRYGLLSQLVKFGHLYNFSIENTINVKGRVSYSTHA
jgi:hypothetical protein